MQRISIIIPCYNEARHLTKVLTQLNQVNKIDSVIVIDDGSTDETFTIAKKNATHALRHQFNLGKGSALKTGCVFAFDHLGSDYVILMDADEQHSVDDLPSFISEIHHKKSLILGVRSYKGMPKQVAFFNKFVSLLIALVTGKYIPDIPSGYKAFSHSAYKQLEWQASGYEVELEMAWKIAHKRLPFVKVPIETIYPNYVRGMSIIDGIKSFFKVFGVR